MIGLAIANSAQQAIETGTIVAAGDTGDTAWIMASSALVLVMALPGLALFYGGLAREKNFLSVTIQVGAIVALASLLWIMAGYTLAFGDVTTGWLGNGRAWMLNGLGNVRLGLAIPESAFALFQMTFAAFTPALMVGAWVGRARFAWLMTFCAIWSLVVYAPVAHWIWGGGWLSGLGLLDFAGGLVGHTSAGVSALVVALLLGRRQGFPSSAVQMPHAPGLTMLGGMLLWVGWLGFSGGSALAATDDAAAAIINTHLAASAAALVWMLIERINIGKPTTVGFATGAVAGLSTISPAAGFVGPGASILLGIAGSLLCYSTVRLVKNRLRIDDSFNVFAIHGMGGMLGSLLVAVLMAPAFGGVGYPDGSDMTSVLGTQAFGIVVVAVFSAVASAIIALGVNMIIPMRVSEDDEGQGLDITSHGERGWNIG